MFLSTIIYELLVFVPYIFGAALYSVLGLLAAWVYRDFVQSTANGVVDGLGLFARITYRWIWMPARVLLAVIQLPVHLSLLFARLDTIIGRALLLSMGMHFGTNLHRDQPSKQGEGLELWGYYVSICNLALTTWAILHTWVVWNMKWRILADDSVELSDTIVMHQGGVRKANFEARKLYVRLWFLERLDVAILWIVLLLRGIIFLSTGSFVTIAQ